MTGRPTSVPGDAAHWDARYAQAAHEHATVWSTTPNATVAAVLSDVTPGTATRRPEAVPAVPRGGAGQEQDKQALEEAHLAI